MLIPPGIVSLLFCGICLKHYAYHNMSRRTQLTTKFTFDVMAQLSENFIFIYLGLSLFTEPGLEYKPLFILVSVIGICVARWCAVFPLSSLINWFIRYRARRRGQDVAEEIPQNWKIMIFWAGLRGAVGVALAAGLTGQHGYALKATVLVVVVLTVIIFGGTTARMLEILNIRIGVIEDLDSDDEFDTEPVPRSARARRNGSIHGGGPYDPSRSGGENGSYNLGRVGTNNTRLKAERGQSYSTSNSKSPTTATAEPLVGRRSSSRAAAQDDSNAEQGLLGRHVDEYDSEDGGDDLDLPPSAPHHHQYQSSGLYNNAGGPTTMTPPPRDAQTGTPSFTARGAFNQILNATSEDAGTLFHRLDENFLKPHLLLDPSGSSRHGGNPPPGSGGGGSPA